MPVSFKALSKFASICRRDKRPVTGLSLRSLFAVREELMKFHFNFHIYPGFRH